MFSHHIVIDIVSIPKAITVGPKPRRPQALLETLLLVSERAGYQFPALTAMGEALGPKSLR